MTARDIGKTAPRGREAPLLDLALVSNSGISLPYPRYIRKATALACPSQVRATSPVKRPRLWGSEVRAPVALICQYIDRHKERFEAWPICRVLSDSGTKIAPATALHHTTGHYPPGRSRDHPRSRGVYACLGSELAPVVRIIPARARFTCGAVNFGLHATDHPRSRGVYACLGSELAPVVRIIPARAGFTRWRAEACPGRADHPRSRGVYAIDNAKSGFETGSSPLARGLRAPTGGAARPPRIIPARAGFTSLFLSASLQGWDHPRSRGVYSACHQSQIASRGSSPLARGLPGPRRHDRHGRRIIPARAGFTRGDAQGLTGGEDHPRSRGVYKNVS